MHRFVLMLALLFFLPNAAYSSPLLSEKNVIEINEDVMRQVGHGDYLGGMKRLSPYSSADQGVLEQLANGFRAARSTSEKYGPADGFEFVSKEVLGPAVMRLAYLERGEMEGIVWRFTWYRSRKGWVCTYVNVSEGVSSLFQ